MASGTSASITGQNRVLPEMRIVLIGGRHGRETSGKSAVGNIILGRGVFETNRRKYKSVMRQEEVSGRQVTVVDTAEWRSSLPLDLTPKLTQLDIQQSVYMCPPGPHVFVLVMPLDTTYVGTGMSVEEHMSLLGDRVWRHTIVVFTVDDKNKMIPVKDLIRNDPDLRSLIEICEDRFHVLNITDRGDGSQVTELLEKVEQMVTSNGGHYEKEKLLPAELKETERTIRRAEERREHAQKRLETTCVTPVPNFRIVLFGRRWSGKSSAGNTILGQSVFKTGQRSVECEVQEGEVAGRHLTVVDSPGWFYNSQDTSEMDKLEIQNSVYLCLPGPHAVLLMVRVDRAFTKAQRVAVEEHMALLTQSIWSCTVVLFTYGDCLGDTSIEQHIEAEGEDLRWLVDKCYQRYHVFNNDKRDDAQVTELLKKIEGMVESNKCGPYFKVDDRDVSDELSEMKMKIEDHAQRFMTRTHRQRAALKALFEGERQSLPDVRVMLVGGEQTGRSRAGDSILQKSVFRCTLFKEFKTQTQLTECVRQQSQGTGRNVSVVNCPDWSTTPPTQKIKDILLHGVTLCSPGPHAVLLTVSVKSSFSEDDRRSVEKHMELLGDRVWRHTQVLFTWGWWLGERCVEEYIESEGEPLRWLLEKCGYRYHVLDSISEVTQLMEKIEDMVTRNRGHFDPLDSRDDRSVRDKGHFCVVGRARRVVGPFERLTGRRIIKAEELNNLEVEWKQREEEWKQREEEWERREEEWVRREEEWRRREEEMVGRVVKFARTEPITLPVRRRRSMDIRNPSMSGSGPPSIPPCEKVAQWLRKRDRSPPSCC